MKNLFDKDASTEILNRLETLQPNAKAQWGKMTVSQMLAHCVVPIKVSLGEQTPKRTLMGVIFGKMGKRMILKDEPFKQGLPTDPSFVIKTQPDFYEKKQELKSSIEKLLTTDKNAMAARSHPFFGRMTAEEWGILGYKHLDHHLRQFGV
jgi:hypothetical protein